MKKIYCFILFALCSQAYGQIHLDSATYYTLITKARWIYVEDVDKDSLPEYSSGETRLIDTNYYWVPDPHCRESPLSYQLQIKETVFILHVKDTFERMEIDFYVYGWFIDDSTMKIIESKHRIKKNKMKAMIPETYKRFRTNP